MRTLSGVRPGDFVADLVFALVLQVLQQELYKALESEGLLESFSLDLAGPFGGGGSGLVEVLVHPPTYME